MTNGWKGNHKLIHNKLEDFAETTIAKTRKTLNTELSVLMGAVHCRCKITGTSRILPPSIYLSTALFPLIRSAIQQRQRRQQQLQ